MASDYSDGTVEQPLKCVFATCADGSTAVCSPRGLCISSLPAPSTIAGARVPAALACALSGPTSNAEDPEAVAENKKRSADKNASPSEARTGGRTGVAEAADAQMDVDEKGNDENYDADEPATNLSDGQEDEAASESAFSVASSRDEMSSSSAKLRDLKLFVCYSNAQVATFEPFCVCHNSYCTCIYGTSMYYSIQRTITY